MPIFGLRHDLEFAERSNRQTVVREPPFYPGGLFFGFIGVLTLAFPLNTTGRGTDVLIVGIVAAGLPLGMALYCCVDSTYGVVHGGRTLCVQRELWALKWVRRYAPGEIAAIRVRRTWRHGEGLVLQRATGKSKSLTWSLHFQALDRHATAPNHAIRVGGRGL